MRVKVGGCWRWPRSMMAAPGPGQRGLAALGCRPFGTGWCGSTRDTQAMSLHLAEVAQAVAPGAHGVMLMDRAGWHRATDLVVPDNLTLVLLPARAPELNPVENIWQFLRDNWLSSRVFGSYADIVDHCCSAWNRLIDQPWIIMSIGLRDWANASNA